MIFKGYQWMLTALISMSLAFMTAGTAHAQSCNDATIQGSCVLQAVASPTTAAVPAGGGPEALAGLITFDGATSKCVRTRMPMGHLCTRISLALIRSSPTAMVLIKTP